MMRSRIATAAIAASLVAGLAACSSSKSGSGGAGVAPAPSVSTAAAGAAPSSSPTDPAATVPSATATGSGFSAAQLEMMRAKVAAVFGEGVTASSPHGFQPTPDPKELAADFDSPATMKAVWGTSTSTGASRPMACGMAKYNGVAIGAIQAAGATATVPVVLYQGANAGPAEVTVTLDPASGVIKGVTCGGAPNPADVPGIAPIAAYYGATANLDTAVLNDKSKSFFTPAFTAWRPVSANYEIHTCSQDVPSLWLVALTGKTSATSTWDYAPGLVMTLATPATPETSTTSAIPTGFPDSMAVDLASAKISRVTCFTANPPAADPAHPAQYAAQLLEFYRQAAEQQQLGVDAKSAIRPAFVSDAAFATAWSNTGTVPLLCASKLPGSVQTAAGTKPVTSGSDITLSMVTWPDWHPDNAGQETSKFALVLDASSMKIASITCTK